jgi:sialidase-1
MLATADGKHSYGSFFSFTSKRLYHWSFNKSSSPRPPPPPQPPAAAGVQLLFGNGVDISGYSCHRVPSAINTGNSIIVIVESRHFSCADQEPKDLTMRRSTDGGITWSSIARVLGNTVLTNNSHTYRNPVPVHHIMRNGSEVVLLNTVNSTPVAAVAGAQLNSRFGKWPSMQLKSWDDGISWSHPERVVGMGKYDGVLAGPGIGIVLGRHSLANQRNKTLNKRIIFSGDGVVWYSDNDGESYTVSPSYYQQMGESQVVELNDGTLRNNFRKKTHPVDCRGVSTSSDGGHTWSSPADEPQLIGEGCSAGLINGGAVASSGASTLFFSNPADTTKRVKMTLRRSDDSGEDWNHSKLVWPGTTGYSVLVPINLTHVGLVFESGEVGGEGRRGAGVSFVALPKLLDGIAQ